ncbi:iron ABC transporter permease [Cohnella sp. WQ 127256]|uniref:FecCD family ABC transporter permease n=1 Tax=Cohnella sp. WQ 127256 TaxID=2938790 RepID=UPI002117C8B7|nr:iron ABC transporter permease [Cohnella sp. WQ 127256]
MDISSKKGSSEPQHPIQIKSRPWAAMSIILIGLLALLLGLMLSVSFGAKDIDLATVWSAIFRFNPDLTEHQVIHALRLPRVLAGAMVGASLAVAGAMMQGMTRNPLADSGLLGLNAGAGLALALCFAFFPGLPFLSLMLFSFLGATLGGVLIFGIGSISMGGLTPMRLTLAGAAISALLLAFSQGIALHYRVGQSMTFWYAGGVAGTRWDQVELMFPWIIGGLIGAMLLSRFITLLSFGEEFAVGLGMRVLPIKIALFFIVLMLAGISVAVAGVIGFIGLLIPHLTRALVGVDYRWIIPCSAVLGALLVVAADFGARMINMSFETPVGALIALIGVPFFLYLVRKERRELT